MVTARSVSRRPRRLALACGLSMTMLVACSSARSSAPSVPLPTLAPSTLPTQSSSTSTTVLQRPPPITDPATTTTASASTTILNPPPTITFPATSTTTSVALPPVTTLVPEVSADLLSPTERDPADPNNSRPIQPDQVPVIEAHLRLLQLGTKVSSTWPIDADSPLLLEAPLTPENLRSVQDAARGRLAMGEVLNVSQGVTFRPYVVGPVTDTATVMDCELAGHYWVKADTGEPIPPTEIWPASPGHIVQVGLRETWTLRNGQWLVLEQVIDPSACA
jgi:hypothetical protein